MVGGWCYRKGCDLIVDAVRQLECSCLHVGSLGDCAFPEGDVLFTHVEAVNQREFVHYYHHNGCLYFLRVKKVWQWYRRRP